MRDGVGVIGNDIGADDAQDAGVGRAFEADDIAAAARVAEMRGGMGEDIGGLAGLHTVASEELAGADHAAVARDVGEHALPRERFVIEERAADKRGGGDADECAHAGTELTFQLIHAADIRDVHRRTEINIGGATRLPESVFVKGAFVVSAVGAAANFALFAQAAKAGVLGNAVITDANRDDGDALAGLLQGALGDAEDTERERQDAPVVGAAGLGVNHDGVASLNYLLHDVVVKRGEVEEILA